MIGIWVLIGAVALVAAGLTWVLLDRASYRPRASFASPQVLAAAELEPDATHGLGLRTLIEADDGRAWP